MKKILLFAGLFCVINASIAQENMPTIYLVRHAEKETGNDPVLTETGKKRAGELMRALKDKKISRIYITNYRRSEMTADSLRIQLEIDTIYYSPDSTGEDLISKLRRNNDLGKNVLVIGHTNTIPRLIKALGVEDFQLHDIPDNEFDNLYLVKFKGNKAYLEQRKYGDKN